MSAPIVIGDATLHLGDCLDVLKTMPDCSVDAVVTDPPYALSFMGRAWDKGLPDPAIWIECLRVLKPGGHLLAFGGTRTHHRLWCQIEDAGFELRETVGWMYGSGFPKSLDVSKAIDKTAGCASRPDATAPATAAARQWSGFGTALKPAFEPIALARKPLSEKTIAANVLKHGCGGLNIDGCRVEYESDADKESSTPQGRCTAKPGALAGKIQRDGERLAFDRPEQKGRFPANLIHDGSEDVVALFPETGKSIGGRIGNAGGGSVQNIPTGKYKPGNPGFGDQGSAARFFYAAKASKSDRGEGNTHPCVKPQSLMRYLCRLITPPGGVVLDPFAGSGSTGKAALLEGFRFIGIEREAEYVSLARARIASAQQQPSLALEPAA